MAPLVMTRTIPALTIYKFEFTSPVPGDHQEAQQIKAAVLVDNTKYNTTGGYNISGK